jgi:phage/plasmid-like protein (TIGR03299 family)
MMYVGQVPWHGLGTKLHRPATAEEAIRAANLDWEVEKKLLIAVGGTVMQPTGKYAVVRKDLWDKKRDLFGNPNCPILGIVGEDYTPLQNREAFAFFDSIVGAGAAIYHTAGALGQGERVWILAKLPDAIKVANTDITDKYLLLSNSHDGNSAVQIKFTPIRVVCNNTLTLALRQGPPAVWVSHTKDIHKRLELAKRTLGIIHRGYEEIEAAFQNMARVDMDDQRLRRYLKQVFPDPRDRKDRAAAQEAEKHRDWAKYFFANGKKMTSPASMGPSGPLTMASPNILTSVANPSPLRVMTGG